MRNKLFMYALIPTLGLGFFGAQVASAHWFSAGVLSEDEVVSRQTQMFTETANLLGLPVDIIKEAWANGKTMREIAQENNISDQALYEKMQTARKERMQVHLKTLVEKGVITQAQADARVQAMETRGTKIGKGMQGGRHGRPGDGLGRGMGMF